MHIPENYLSPQTCAVMAAAMVPVWTHAVRKVRTEIPKAKMPLLGASAAFCFIGMMFNVPLPGGTTGHAVGGTLIAILLGPEAACLSVTIALLIQALLFGDGGILAFGANCFNMAFVLPFTGYAVCLGIRRIFHSEKSKYAAAAIGSYVGINAAALCAAVEFGIQPILFHNAAGQALYCPYGLSVSVPMMMIGHLTIFGLAEIVFTTAIYAFLSKTAPDIAQARFSSKKISAAGTFSWKPLAVLLSVLICAVPLGLLADGTAWGEWGTDEIASLTQNGTVLGYTPAGMQKGFSLASLLPDYTVAGLPEWFGYIVCAVIGVSLSVILFRLIACSMKEKNDFSTPLL